MQKYHSRRLLLILLPLCVLLLLSGTASAIDLFNVPQWLEKPISDSNKNLISLANIAAPWDNSSLYKDEVLTMDSDFIIGRGQSVTLDNVTLLMNSSRDGRYRIEVRDGGALTVNHSSISSSDGKHAFLFIVQKNGSLHMFDSVVRNCGYEGPDKSTYGLWIGSNNNALDRVTFSDDYYGLLLNRVTDNVFTNGTIDSSKYGIFIDSSNNNVLINDTITGNAGGILINASSMTFISESNISSNAGYGIKISGSGGLNMIMNNTIADNGVGIDIQDSPGTTVIRNDMRGNVGPAISVGSSDFNALINNTMVSNGYGIFLNRSSNNALTGNNASYNRNDGIFLNQSDNNIFTGNNASFNGGSGYNVSASSKRALLSKSSNPAVGNGMGDYDLPASSLSLAEISLMSVIIAFADKTLYLIDFEKIIVTNIFSGIVNPIREPLSNRFERALNRLLSYLGINRWGYRSVHFSSPFKIQMFHFIEGQEICSIAYTRSPHRLLCNEIVLQQIRFVDMLLKDRALLVRNAAYFAIMTGIGVAVYFLQVTVGTYRLPYLLPVAIQFGVMFPIGLIIQNGVIGRVERIRYDFMPKDMTDELRMEIGRNMESLNEKHEDGKVKDSVYEAEMEKLRDVLSTVNYLEARKEYLTYTVDGCERSIELYEKFLRADPEDPLLLAGMGEAYAMLCRLKAENGDDFGEYAAKAMEAAKMAFAIDNAHVEVRRAMAQALMCAGNIKGAEKEITEALKLNPRDVEALHFSAMIKEDPAVRIKLLERAVSINPFMSMARRDLADEYIKRDQPDKALPHIEKALEIYKNDPYAHHYLSKVYSMQGKPSLAIEENKKALALYPGFNDVKKELSAAAVAHS